VLSGDLLSAIGSGMTLPFFVVYLHSVRGIGLAMAGLALSTLALAGFVGNPAGGWLSDRIGARRAVVTGLVVSAVGAGSLALVRSPWQAFVAAAVVGLGAAITWPSLDTLLATVVAAEQRSSVFSVRHATMNAGLGLGALLAALIVHEASSTTFVSLYVIDGLSFLAFVPIALSVHPRADQPPDDAGPAVAIGFASVLRDTVFLRVWLLTAALVAVGYAQLNGIFPAFAVRPDGVSPGVLGLVFAVNTVTVVALQLVVLRLMAGRRRCRGLQLTALFWAGTWAITFAAGYLGGGLGALVGFALAAAVFAIGETFVAPSLAPMVNALAPDDLRGRYNGLYTLAWTTGFAVGPAVATVALEKSGSNVFLGLVLVCGAIVWGAGRLDRRLVPAARLVTVDVP
jgi:MFS family permease